jgi:endonuclease YncB( thermonuclease family)
MKSKLILFFTFSFIFFNAQLKENTFYKVSKISDGDTFYVKTEILKNLKSD